MKKSKSKLIKGKNCKKDSIKKKNNSNIILDKQNYCNKTDKTPKYFIEFHNKKRYEIFSDGVIETNPGILFFEAQIDKTFFPISYLNYNIMLIIRCKDKEYGYNFGNKVSINFRDNTKSKFIKLTPTDPLINYSNFRYIIFEVYNKKIIFRYSEFEEFE